MTNVLITPSVVARLALAQLYNDTVLAPLVYRDFDPEFAAKVGDTVVVRKPTRFTAQTYTQGGGITVQNANEGSYPIQLNQHIDVSFGVTSRDLTLTVRDFNEQFIVPAKEAINQRIDMDIAAALLAAAAAGGVQKSGTAVAATDLITIANHGFRPGDRVWVISKTGGTGLSLLTPYFVLLSGWTTGVFKVALTDGGAAIDITVDASAIVVAEAGNAKAVRDSKAVNGGAADTGLINARAALTANKMPSNDRFGVWSPEGTAELLKDPLFVRANESGSTDGLREASIGKKFGIDNYESQVFSGIANSVAFHRQAVSLVTRPLELPMGVAPNMAHVEAYKGFGLRVVMTYDQTNKQDICSIDLLYGIQAMRPAGAIQVDLTPVA